jgi:hypothetical protein
MTADPYAVVAAPFSLAQLYREQDRLEREKDRWERLPYGASQVAMRQQRIEILEGLIAQRYVEA